MNDQISERTAIIASYALWVFQFWFNRYPIRGIGGMAPNRKEIYRYCLKAMIGGALASWLTATIAGLLL